MKATGILRREHSQILRGLNVLEQMTERARRGETISDRDAADILAFLEGFADRHHQGKEEAVLFPALLRDREQKHYKALCHMIFEHNRERSLVEGLKDAIENRNNRDFIYCGAQLIKKLRAHVETEDLELCELVDAALSPEEDLRIARDLESYEEVWQEKVLSDLMQRLDDMETRYAGGSHAGIARRT